jgi:hypothetical protein
MNRGSQTLRNRLGVAKGHVRASHPKQSPNTPRYRRRPGRGRQPFPQLPAAVEWCAEPRIAGDPAQSPHGRRSLARQCPLMACAVKRRRFPVGANPTRQPLQPEATGAAMEVTKWLKPSDSVSRNTVTEEPTLFAFAMCTYGGFAYPSAPSAHIRKNPMNWKIPCPPIGSCSSCQRSDHAPG